MEEIFSNINQNIENEEYYKRNAEVIDKEEREASNKGLLILGAICLIIWFLFLR